ncbi:hypothetical protein [Ornithinimicrobium sufpigmenti]|uniref:hypothetical protein n=1 Tax=Ornithinimicrobium sufpigmenti TaxID=2508882 RepID=UPI0015E1987F|nr:MULTISPECIES: hypothetical protein [unclassified Ornithinimicrobium]
MRFTQSSRRAAPARRTTLTVCTAGLALVLAACGGGMTPEEAAQQGDTPPGGRGRVHR